MASNRYGRFSIFTTTQFNPTQLKAIQLKQNHISPALAGAIVGAKVTAVEGLAIGEADGPDGTLALPMTFLMTLLYVSAMYIVPEAVSIATL